MNNRTDNFDNSGDGDIEIEEKSDDLLSIVDSLLSSLVDN